MTQNANTFTFTDTGATIDIGLVPSCSRVSVTAVSCTPDAGESSDDGDVYRLKADLGDLGDTATLATRRRADASGGTGDDSITGGAAAWPRCGATIWIGEDRCDGTMTTVRRGLVEVRDLVRKRTVMVPAGRRYVAAKPAR